MTYMFKVILYYFQMYLETLEINTGGRCNAIHRYAKANNKCMKNYNKNVESLFIEYLDANNVYGCLKNYLLENLNG